MVKQILPFIFRNILFSIACFFVYTFSADAAQSKHFIAVIKSREIPPYSQALDGIKKTLSEKQISAVYKEYLISSDDDSDTMLPVIREIKARKPVVVVTLGTLATELSQRYIKDIPIVFSMVLNPVDNGFVSSMEMPGGNITGASMDISAKDQFAELKQVLPKTKKIGVLYNPKETGAVVEQAAKVSHEMGLEFIARKVASEKDVPKAIESLDGQIDVLWAVADSTVFGSQTTQSIILYTLQIGLPFMGISTSFVKAGALLAVFVDPEDIGRQSGEIIISILNGQKPSEIPVSIPRKTFLSLNLRIAEQIKVKIPGDIVKKAKEVLK